MFARTEACGCVNLCGSFSRGSQTNGSRCGSCKKSTHCCCRIFVGVFFVPHQLLKTVRELYPSDRRPFLFHLVSSLIPPTPLFFVFFSLEQLAFDVIWTLLGTCLLTRPALPSPPHPHFSPSAFLLPNSLCFDVLRSAVFPWIFPQP